MKKEIKNTILKAAKHVDINENIKATEEWPPCTSILFRPKRKVKK